MRLLIMSDIHVELHADFGEAFIFSLDKNICDVVVVAGDLGDSQTFRQALENFAQRFAPKPVLYVHGNHEFYGSVRGKVLKSSKDVQRKWPNLHVLNNDVIEIEGQRFLGTPLWFPDHPEIPIYRNQIGDYIFMHDHGEWISQQNIIARKFIAKHLREGDVLITHYLPSHLCVHPKYTNSPLNIFFVCEIGDLIVSRKPKLAIHGHTHESIDTKIGDTRVVCNPYGYVGVELNQNFNERFVVEV